MCFVDDKWTIQGPKIPILVIDGCSQIQVEGKSNKEIKEQ